jgi:hypothetical protein
MNDRNVSDTQNRKTNLVMWVFLGFIAYFLITEHWAHIVPFLPWLILAACPLMHLFMHGGHGHGERQHHKED